MLGNEAVARGLYEAGCSFVSSYPGTPSTEMTEAVARYPEVDAEWAPNDKVAMESAFGASLAGKRSFCGMKRKCFTNSRRSTTESVRGKRKNDLRQIRKKQFLKMHWCMNCPDFLPTILKSANTKNTILPRCSEILKNTPRKQTPSGSMIG